jgi:hypothetical protein
MLRQFPFLSRLSSKLVYELLPGAIISGVGGIMLNQYYVKPPVAVTVAAPASAEIVQAMHSEQTRLIDYLAKTSEARPQAPAAAPQDGAESRPAESAVVARTTKSPEAKAVRTEKSEKRIASKPPRQAPVGQPLQLTQTATNATAVQPATQPKPAPAAAAAPQRDDNVVVAKLRDVTTTVQQIPARVRSAVTWSLDDFPPRPPMPVIGQNFLKASL